MRTAHRIVPAALALSLCACSYSPEAVGITALIDGIPASASALTVTVTDANGRIKMYYPSFGPGTSSTLQLSFAPPAAGDFTVAVMAQDAAKTDLADGEQTGTYAAQGEAQVSVTLVAPK